MAKCQRNDVASLILDGPATAAAAGGHSRLWTVFSGSAFRRAIFDAVSCGGGSRHRNRHREEDDVFAASVRSTAKAPEKRKAVRSEKLSDLLSMADSPEAESDAETKRKEEALEELKRVARGLQAEDLSTRKEAARSVRLRAKEDSETRVTLAMLGAIPPLVGMLDSEDADSQIASLYALLNLGIGNDV